MPYEEILKRLEEYRAELADEERKVRAGLKRPGGFSAIRERHEELFTDETLQTVRAAIERTMPGTRQRDQVERALFAMIEGTVAKTSLPAEDALANARHALKTSDAVHSYAELSAAIAREADPGERLRLHGAFAALADELTARHLEREHARRQRLAAFGFRSIQEFAEAKKRVRYGALLEKTVAILGETTGLYRRVMSDVLRQAYGLELGEVPPAHGLHWLSGPDFAHLFPAERMRAAAEQALDTLGLPLAAVAAIRTDADPRPGKRPEASFHAVRVPDEIHLLCTPRVGPAGPRELLHEAAGALHLAGADPLLPYEWRGLPRSPALTLAFSRVVANLFENPLWLEHVLRVPKGAAERLAAWSLLGNLYQLRRAVALFTYELAFDEKPYDNARNRGLFAETRKDLTGFAIEPAFFLEALGEGSDPLCSAGFRSADMLRGWIAAAQLEEHLVRKLGDRWFLKRDAGASFKELFRKGVSWDAEELVQSLGMTPWDTLPLVRRFDGVSRLLR